MNCLKNIAKASQARQFLYRFSVGFVLSVVVTSSMAQNLTTTTPMKFPPNFKGDNCDALASSLKNKDTGKDEFETTANYERRMKELLSSISIYGKSLAQPKFFVNSKQITAIYDADKGSMTVYGSLGQSTQVSDTVRYASTAIINTRHSNETQYKGQNSFGASTTVDQYQNDICGVAFLNVSPVTDYEWMGSIEFPLAADIARRSKDNITIVYLAHLAPPILINYRQRIAPTLDSPTEIIVTGDALIAVLERFVVLNKATGEVLFEKEYTPR